MTSRSTTVRALRWALASAAPLLGGAVACFPEDAAVSGKCTKVDETTRDCRFELENHALIPAGLVGYACTGTARPDLESTSDDGVPLGLLCADKDPLPTGERTYCCTEKPVTCAYDPAQECEEGHDGYQCYGNNRPESLNPLTLCSNGTQERGLNNYCCSGRAEPSPCTEDSAIGCDTRLLGFRCLGDGLPKGEDYGANKSRADTFYPVCSVPKPAPNPAYNQYCCFVATTVPVGGTCVRQPTAEGCEPGRFAFACTGPDDPEDDFPTMKCPDPPVSGTSHEGYAARLYCCDFT